MKLVITVPTQVKQESQLLHSHPVCDKTQTLNIVETQHTNTATAKPDPHATNTSNRISRRILEIKQACRQHYTRKQHYRLQPLQPVGGIVKFSRTPTSKQLKIP